jgi:hypothetical protein
MTQRSKARSATKARQRNKTRSAAGPDQRDHRAVAVAPQSQTGKSPTRNSGGGTKKRPRLVPRWMWLNGLALIMFSAFVIFATLQSIFGWHVHNEELVQAGQPALPYWHYLGTGHFAEALFENWESEFLQMGSYVLLTAFLVQRGSPESKPLGQEDRADDQPERAGADGPALSRTRGVAQWLYRNSLSLVLFAFFGLSFVGHLLGGTAGYNQEQALESGAAPITAWQFLGSSDFWFQSMQNWQSEFLAVGCLVVLGIVLRQHGSPESKPVTAPDSQTGE